MAKAHLIQSNVLAIYKYFLLLIEETIFSYFVYFQKQKSSNVYLLDATMVFPMALLIFGDGVKQGITEGQPYISAANKYL